jgi:hypothetical protein
MTIMVLSLQSYSTNEQVLPKSKSTAGLGRTLINDRVKTAQKTRENAKNGKPPKVSNSMMKLTNSILQIVMKNQIGSSYEV